MIYFSIVKLIQITFKYPVCQAKGKEHTLIEYLESLKYFSMKMKRENQFERGRERESVTFFVPFKTFFNLQKAFLKDARVCLCWCLCVK